jgi:acylphosphatase
MMRTVHILISGRVQGVYFRKFTKHKAMELGILGTVKNLPDGRVEIIAQANQDTIDHFINWCRKGPITARVDQVDIAEMTTTDEFSVFEVI